MTARAYTLEEENEELRKHVQKLQKSILETRWDGVQKMANESATMFASEADMLADRKQFVKNLGWLLCQTRDEVEEMPKVLTSEKIKVGAYRFRDKNALPYVWKKVTQSQFAVIFQAKNARNFSWIR